MFAMWGENPDWLPDEPTPEPEAVETPDDDFPPFHHRQDATTEAVERLLAVMGFGSAPEGLQGPTTRRPFPRDTRSADA